MAVPEGDAEFVAGSYLTYIVPFATNSRLEQVLEQQDEPPKGFFESIQDREWLFFGTPFSHCLRDPVSPHSLVDAR